MSSLFSKQKCDWYTLSVLKLHKLYKTDVCTCLYFLSVGDNW